MTGIARFNFPLFDEVAADLRAEGWYVLNPAEHDRAVYPDIETWPGFETGDSQACPQFDRAAALAWDARAITASRAIVLLPGWEGSAGARFERLVAEQTGKYVWLARRECPNCRWSFIADDVKRMQILIMLPDREGRV